MIYDKLLERERNEIYTHSTSFKAILIKNNYTQKSDWKLIIEPKRLGEREPFVACIHIIWIISLMVVVIKSFLQVFSFH